ncbi:MAG: AI-2E family transporter [Candidatus Sericytochromatia bacterium]
MGDRDQDWAVRDRLLGVIVAVLVLGALKAAEPVVLPLVFSLFVVLLAWPLQGWLQRRMAEGPAYGLTLVALLGVAALFIWALAESADEVAEWVMASGPRLEALSAQWREAARMTGMPAGDGAPGALAGVARGVASGLVGTMGFVLLVTTLCVLALREVNELREKLHGPLRTRWDATLIDSAGAIVTQLQRYVVTRCLTSGVTGVLTGLFAWAIGLELALAWGVLTFLLNFVPTLGTLAVVAGITLFAYLQFQAVGMALLVLGVTGVLQVVIGSYVDPRLQGRSLSLSPFAVLLAVVFWGWMWGIPGSLIGVPLTAALMIAFREFASTRWLAEMLNNERPAPAPRVPEPPA